MGGDSGASTRAWIRALAPLIVLALLAALGLRPVPVLAATNSWTGANGALWSDAGNWTLGVPVSGQTLDFPNGTPNVNAMMDNLGTALTVAGMTFHGYATIIAATTETIVTSGDISNADTGGGTATLNLPVDLSANITVSATGAYLTSVDFRQSVGQTGAYTMTTVGQGAVYLEAADTFSNLVIDGASNSLVVDNAQGAVSMPTSVGSGAELNVTSAVSSISSTITIAGTRFGTGAITVASPQPNGTTVLTAVAMTAASEIDTVYAGTVTSIGSVTGGQALTVGGNGAVTFTGANTMASLTVLSPATAQSGTPDNLGAGVTVNSGASLVLLGGTFTTASLTVSGAGNNGNGALAAAPIGATWNGPVFLAADTVMTAPGAPLSLGGGIAGPGALTLDGNFVLDSIAPNTYTGATTFENGTTTLDGTSPSVPSATVTLTGGATAVDVVDYQLTTTATVAVPAGTTWNLNGHRDQVATLNMSGGLVNADGGSQLLLTGTINATSTGSTASRISTTTPGGSYEVFNATPTITVTRGTASHDLEVYASTNPGGPSLTITGGGVAVFYGNGVTVTSPVNITGSGTTVFIDSNFGNATVFPTTGTTLGGSATLNGVTTSGGTVEPGGDPGPGFMLVGRLNLDPTATFADQINGTTAGTGYGYTQSPYPNLNGATLSLTWGFTPVVGDTFDILRTTGNGVTGTFAGLPEGATFVVGGVELSITYDGGNIGGDVVLTVVQAPTTTTLTSSPNPSAFGQAVTFTATVASGANGTPTGTVAFFDGSTQIGTGTLDGSGVAAFTISSLATGTHVITAQYLGDTGHGGSVSAAVNQVVQAAAVVPVPSTGAGRGGSPIPLPATVVLGLGLLLVAGAGLRRADRRHVA